MAVVTDAGAAPATGRQPRSRRERYRAAFIITALAIFMAGVFSAHPHLERWVAFLLILPVALFYLMPSYVAALRGHHKLMAIGAINVLLGWTILGWIVALIWAFTTTSPR
jgi:hypothetical protein